MTNEAPESTKPTKPSIVSIVLSTFAAAFGVQSSKNHERDFQHSSFVPYIIAGIIFTVAFMLTLIFVVKMVLTE